MTSYTDTRQPPEQFGSHEAFLVEVDKFASATGLDFLDLVSSFSEEEARLRHPGWVVNWAARLSAWDCWLMVGD
jgi:hypothetical protein